MLFEFHQENCSLLRLNDGMTELENSLLKNRNIFPVLSISKWNKTGKTNNKFITFPVMFIPTCSKRKRRIIAYGLVARYGPQSVASASD